jgi:hypothetical protein
MPELILGPIIGGLSPTSVNLWGRTDGAARLHAWLGHQPDMSDAQLVATSLPLTAETGFAGVTPIKDLLPNIHYRYALTLDKEPPTPNQAPFPKFTTFPTRERADLLRLCIRFLLPAGKQRQWSGLQRNRQTPPAGRYPIYLNVGRPDIC